jgi:HK97 family phage major capsid protein
MTLLDQILALRAARKEQLEKLLQAATDEQRGLNEAEEATYDTGLHEIAGFDARLHDLAEQETSEQAANALRAAAVPPVVPPAPAGAPGPASVHEPNPVYRRGDGSTSFFRDLAESKLNDNLAARNRLVASQETRAGDLTTVAGAGGELAPPLWLIEDFIKIARAGRVTADLCNKMELPPGISSVNLPKGSTGTSTGVQATQNSALSDTAMTTTSVSSGITTIGGKQILSTQLIRQSGIPVDQVVLQDLALAYAVNIDQQVLYGANSGGELRGLVGVATNTAFTTASPAPASVTAANSLYYVVSKVAAAVQTGRFLPPTAIVMHPNRWAWVLGTVDANARPFVVPQGANQNPLGTTGDQVAQGLAGFFGSYPVFTDPNISLTANSATNQDEIYVLRADDLWLYETAVETASFDATYADNASVLFRILGFAAFVPHRYAASVRSIRGTGLVAPA